MSDYSAIPSELRDYDQWILWKLVERDGKATKVPCDATGKPVPVNDPASWLSYSDACAAHATSDKTSGIGFCFTESDPFVGIDLDDCIPLRGDGAEIAARLSGTYGEVSPSGTGIKFIGQGSLPDGHRNRTKDVEGFGQIEVYDRDRFFTVTGNVFGLASSVQPIQIELNYIADNWLKQDDPVTLQPRTIEGASSLLERALGFEGSDDELIALLLEDPKYNALWHGDFSDYGPDGESEADLALCEKIAWLAGPVPERIERIFSASALARPKWFDRQDYRDRTIEKALSGKDDFYNGPGHSTMAAEDLPTPQEIAEAGKGMYADDSAFPVPPRGIIRDMVDLIGPMTESPDSTIALGTLVMLSAIAGWQRPYRSAESEEPCVLYACICGPSAMGRKTTGLRSVAKVFEDAFADDDGLSLESVSHVSGRALIELAIGGVDVFYRKEPKVTALEGEEHEAQMQDYVEWENERKRKLENPPPVVLVWDEFGKMLSVDGDWQRDTRANLLSMYNGKHQGIRTSGKDGLRVPGGKVQMALLATMVNDDLRRGLNSQQATDGLMGRIIFSPDGKQKDPLAFPPKPDSDYDIRKQRLATKILAFRNRCDGSDITDNWSSAAEAMHRAWYHEHYANLSGLERILFGRLQATAKKIACLLAMAEDCPVVDVDHVEVAHRMADISMKVSADAANAAVEAQRDRYCDAVVARLFERGPVPMAKVMEWGMLNTLEQGERTPERELREAWLKKDPRIAVEDGERGKGKKVSIAP